MPARTSLDQERRKQALRKRLALDFQPLRDTLSKGLELLVDPEAAVCCTAIVEGFCNALFTVAIKQLSETKVARTRPSDTKITVFHLQVALRSHPELAELLQRVESARMALEYFMDDATSRALYERKLIASREAKHLGDNSTPSHYEHQDESDSGRRRRRVEEEEELIRRHERTRSEWQKREDDPFSEVDFAMVLKCVHPAFTLSYNATMLLSALVRELLNEVCSRADVDVLQRRRHPPELLLDDLQGPLLEVFCGVSPGKKFAFETNSLPDVGTLSTQIARMTSECLARYRLQSRRGKTLSLHFRVYQPGSSSALQPLHVLPDVARDTPFTKLLSQIRSKCHLPVSVGHQGGTFSDTRGHGEYIAIYRGVAVEPTATPAILGMPTGAIVYIVARKWWDLTRRTEARRGLLASQRPQDAMVKSLVAGTESKVKRELHGAGVNAVYTGKEPRLPAYPKRGLASSTSTSSLSSSSNGTTKSPSRISLTQEEDSLSVLLRERAAVRHEKELEKRRVLANSTNNNNNSEHVSDEDVKTTFTRNNDASKPLESLDEAWIEFEALTKNVQRTTDRLVECIAASNEVQEPMNFSADKLQVLEDEWKARVHSTVELASQTRATHQLAKRMLDHVRPPL